MSGRFPIAAIFGVILLTRIAASTGLARSGSRPKRFRSPDAELTAVVLPADKKKGFEQYESRIVILGGASVRLRAQDFSSGDGEHGYGVGTALWTTDSRFFVCQMSNSGGHSPMYNPVVFWSRKTNRFYELKGYTSDNTFSVVAPDKVRANTWPGMVAATVSLKRLKQGEATELH